MAPASSLASLPVFVLPSLFSVLRGRSRPLLLYMVAMTCSKMEAGVGMTVLNILKARKFENNSGPNPFSHTHFLLGSYLLTFPRGSESRLLSFFTFFDRARLRTITYQPRPPYSTHDDSRILEGHQPVSGTCLVIDELAAHIVRVFGTCGDATDASRVVNSDPFRLLNSTDG